MYSYFSHHSAQQIINFKNCSLSLLCMQMGVFSHAHGLGLPLWFSQCSFETVLTGSHCLGQTSWISLSLPPPLTPLTSTGSHTQNSGLHTCTASTLSTEPSPLPWDYWIFLVLYNWNFKLFFFFFLVNVTHQVDFLFSLDSSNKPFILFWESN